jgi:hypothetical protein
MGGKQREGKGGREKRGVEAEDREEEGKGVGMENVSPVFETWICLWMTE